MPTSKSLPLQKKSIFRLALLLLGFALLLYVIFPKFHEFRLSASQLSNANLAPLLLAIIISFAAHVTSALKYNALAFKRLSFIKTLIVQLAGLLINRLLPIGVGGMGINYIYLRKEQHKPTKAAAVVGMNNALGFVGHSLLVFGLLIVSLINGSKLKNLNFTKSELYSLLGALIVLSVTFLFRNRFYRGIKAWLKDMGSYRHRPWGVTLAVIYSLLIALFYALCLWYSAQALHHPLSLLGSLIVLTLGVSASTVTPTPGGLVGVEAAMVAGLVAYKLTPADALAVTLLYRFITYWLALLIGAVALVILQRQKII